MGDPRRRMQDVAVADAIEDEQEEMEEMEEVEDAVEDAQALRIEIEIASQSASSDGSGGGGGGGSSSSGGVFVSIKDIVVVASTLPRPVDPQSVEDEPTPALTLSPLEWRWRRADALHSPTDDAQLAAPLHRDVYPTAVAMSLSDPPLAVIPVAAVCVAFLLLVSWGQLRRSRRRGVDRHDEWVRGLDLMESAYDDGSESRARRRW